MSFWGDPIQHVTWSEKDRRYYVDKNDHIKRNKKMMQKRRKRITGLTSL